MAIRNVPLEVFSTGWGYALENGKEVVVLGLKINNQHFRVGIDNSTFNHLLPDVQIGDSLVMELHLPMKKRT